MYGTWSISMYMPLVLDMLEIPVSSQWGEQTNVKLKVILFFLFVFSNPKSLNRSSISCLSFVSLEKPAQFSGASSLFFFFFFFFYNTIYSEGSAMAVTL